MRWVRPSLASFSVLLVCLACGGGRETGAPAASGQSGSDTAAGASHDSVATVSDTTPDTTSARMQPPASRDTVPSSASARATAPAKPAAKPAANKPAAPKPAAPKPAAPEPAAPEPAAPKPAPATLDRPDSAVSPATPAETTQTAVAPAETTRTAVAPAAEASAPLRDQYHQAPRDTVTAEVYDGWKQFNLNCARCHGEDVLGTTIAPHLIVSVRPGGAVATKEAFIKVVCEGRPEKGMPAWCPLGLGQDKINAIYLYVKGRSDAKIGPGRPARAE